MKKRVISFLCLLVILCLTFSLWGCEEKSENGEKIKISCTLFPQYDWLKNIVGNSENIELSLIVANGADPHSYQPSAADIMEISNSDMIVLVGGDSEAWVKEAIERSNSEIATVVLAELDGVTLHNVSSASEAHDHHEHEHHGHGAFDEHIWLSLKNAALISEHLTKKLCELDPENASLYRANADTYLQKLNMLDNSFKAAAENADGEAFMLFADRFPFVYLLFDYEIEYQAAFEGCSADVDASFDTVLTLIEEAEEHSCEYITVTESSDKALANTVVNSAKHTKMQILTMNSMQKVSEKDIKNGASYISLMQDNLEVLKVALGTN